MRYCAYRGCVNNRRNCPGKRFYQFPEEQHIRSVWAEACEPSANRMRYICIDHFPDTVFLQRDIIMAVPVDKRRLKQGAVPLSEERQTDRSGRIRAREHKRCVVEAMQDYETMIENEAAMETERQAAEQAPRSVETQTR